jgi:formimidoylglutamate deiminase
MGAVAPGLRADFAVLNAAHVNLEGRSGDRITDALLFLGNDRLVKHVMVSGRWVVRDGHHADEAAIEARFREVQTKLLS